MIHRQCAPLQLNWKDINFNAYGQSREEQQTKAFASFRQTLDKNNVQFDTFRIHVQQKLADIDANLAKRPTGRPTTTTGAVPDIVVQKVQGDASSNSSSKRPSINMSNEQLNLVQTSAIPTIVEPKSSDQLLVLDELTRLRELLEETLVGHAERMPSTGRLLPGSIGGTTASRVSATGLVVSAQQPLQQIDRPTTTMPDGAYPANLNERMTDLQLAVNRLHQDVGAIRQVLERLSPLSTSLLLGRAASRRWTVYDRENMLCRSMRILNNFGLILGSNWLKETEVLWYMDQIGVDRKMIRGKKALVTTIIIHLRFTFHTINTRRRNPDEIDLRPISSRSKTIERRSFAMLMSVDKACFLHLFDLGGIRSKLNESFDGCLTFCLLGPVVEVTGDDHLVHIVAILLDLWEKNRNGVMTSILRGKVEMNIVDNERMLGCDVLKVGTSATSWMFGTPSSDGLRWLFAEPESAIRDERELIVSIEDGIDGLPFVDRLTDPRPEIGRSTTNGGEERERELLRWWMWGVWLLVEIGENVVELRWITFLCADDGRLHVFETSFENQSSSRPIIDGATINFIRT